MLEPIESSAGPQLRVERQTGVERPQRTESIAPAGSYDAPSAPPDDLLAELDRAAGVIDHLAASNVAIHFSVDDAAQALQVQVVDSGGGFLRNISATRLLDVLASGSARGLAFDSTG